MISSRSVTDGVSLSVSKSKLVYSSLIFVDNNVTLICPLTQQRLVTVSVRHTQVIQLIWWDLHLSGQNVQGEWGEWNNQPVCLLLSQMFINFKNYFTSRSTEKCVLNKLITTETFRFATLRFVINYDTYFRLTPFCDIHISQISVGTRLRRDGIFKHEFVANLLSSTSVKN